MSASARTQRFDPLPPDALCRPGGLPSGTRLHLWDEERREPGGQSVPYVATTFRLDGEIACGPCFEMIDVPLALGWETAQISRAFGVWANCRGFRPPLPGETPLPSSGELCDAREQFLSDVMQVNGVLLQASHLRSDLIGRGVLLRYSEYQAWFAFLAGGTPCLQSMFEGILGGLPPHAAAPQTA